MRCVRSAAICGGDFAGGEHVNVLVDGVMFEGYEVVRPWCGVRVGYYGGCGWNEAGIEGGKGSGAIGGRTDSVVELKAGSPPDFV
jgi:hypothetical protein